MMGTVLHNIIVSDDLLGHSKFWEWNFTVQGMWAQVLETVFQTAAAILRERSGYMTTDRRVLCITTDRRVLFMTTDVCCV